MRNYIEEGRSLRIVLSVFDKSLRDEIETYYQHCLEDADSHLLSAIQERCGYDKEIEINGSK